MVVVSAFFVVVSLFLVVVTVFLVVVSSSVVLSSVVVSGIVVDSSVVISVVVSVVVVVVLVSLICPETLESSRLSGFSEIGEKNRPTKNITTDKITKRFESISSVDIKNKNYLIIQKAKRWFENSGLTAVKSETVDAPVINEFPICLECKFIEYQNKGR